MWELDCEESWALKNWCFWTVVLEKTLESPLDCKEIQPVHPKEISPKCSLEGLMLKLKLRYFGHLMRRVDSLEKTLMLGGIGGRRRGDDRGWDGCMASLTRWTWVWVNSSSWWWTGRPGMVSQRVGHDWATELNWTEDFFKTKICCYLQNFILKAKASRGRQIEERDYRPKTSSVNLLYEKESQIKEEGVDWLFNTFFSF